jgi:hypothetical protein
MITVHWRSPPSRSFSFVTEHAPAAAIRQDSCVPPRDPDRDYQHADGNAETAEHADEAPARLSDLHHDRDENDQHDEYDGPKDYAINLRLEELLKTVHFFLISLTAPSSHAKREPRRRLGAAGLRSPSLRFSGERKRRRGRESNAPDCAGVPGEKAPHGAGERPSDMTDGRSMPEPSRIVPIGIGGSLAAAPLPHHRTYGSVSGGSTD